MGRVTSALCGIRVKDPVTALALRDRYIRKVLLDATQNKLSRSAELHEPALWVSNDGVAFFVGILDGAGIVRHVYPLSMPLEVTIGMLVTLSVSAIN